MSNTGLSIFYVTSCNQHLHLYVTWNHSRCAFAISPWDKTQRQNCGGAHSCQDEKDRSTSESVLIVFFNIHEVVHCEFVLQGQTVDAKFYCTEMSEGGHSPQMTWALAQWQLDASWQHAHLQHVFTRKFMTTPTQSLLPTCSAASSPKWNSGWGVAVLTQQRSWWSYRMGLLDSVGREHGRSTGSGVSLHNLN